MEIETRSLMQAPELRAEGNQVAGFAVRYNSETVIAGAFREKFAPGAFTEAIKGDVRALFNHEDGKVLGRTKSGTLKLREDQEGLSYELDLPDTTVGRDLKVSMQRGDIDGSSFGFTVKREQWDDTGDLPLRTVLEAGLREVSPVPYPAYEDSMIALRSRDKAKDEAQKDEREAQKARDLYALRKAQQEQKFRRL